MGFQIPIRGEGWESDGRMRVCWQGMEEEEGDTGAEVILLTV